MLRPSPAARAAIPPLVVVPNDASPVESCVTCGAPAGTPYCATCGERRAADRPHSLRALSEELWDAFSPVDGRIARTLWSLVARPGELTVQYIRGVRLPYVPPLRLFLLVNIVYFVFSSAIDVRAFDTPLATQMRDGRIADRAERMVIHRLAERGTSFAEYTARFDERSTTQAKSLVLLMVPAFAAVVAALEARRSRLALGHLTFAVHAYTTLLLIGMAMQGSFIVSFRWLARSHLAWLRAHHAILWIAQSFDAVVSAGIAALLALWLWHALRRVYGDGRLMAALKAVVLVYAIVQILFLYRDVLFFSVFYTT